MAGLKVEIGALGKKSIGPGAFKAAIQTIKYSRDIEPDDGIRPL